MKPTLLHARWLVAALGAISIAAAAAGDPTRARLQYLQHCAGCHLADGSGEPAKGIPSMRGPLGLFLTVPGGREFIVQVPGVMNSPLSDSDTANLMNWLLPAVTADTLPAGTAPYTTAEIARLRGTRPVNVMAVRAELMHRLQQSAAPVRR
ncbi:MAG: hypothetical protein LKCHEGNO_02669 [Burkholderiaceae bacterium]|nr:hypothetical protein [Burkholderiaceae bacterium]